MKAFFNIIRIFGVIYISAFTLVSCNPDPVDTTSEGLDPDGLNMEPVSEEDAGMAENDDVNFINSEEDKVFENNQTDFRFREEANGSNSPAVSHQAVMICNETDTDAYVLLSDWSKEKAFRITSFYKISPSELDINPHECISKFEQISGVPDYGIIVLFPKNTPPSQLPESFSDETIPQSGEVGTNGYLAYDDPNSNFKICLTQEELESLEYSQGEQPYMLRAVRAPGSNAFQGELSWKELDWGNRDWPPGGECELNGKRGWLFGFVRFNLPHQYKVHATGQPENRVARSGIAAMGDPEISYGGVATIPGPRTSAEDSTVPITGRFRYITPLPGETVAPRKELNTIGRDRRGNR